MKTTLLTAARGAAVALILSIAGPSAAQVTSPAATSPEPAALPLTLEEAVQRAVEHNPALALVRIGTEVEAAKVAESRSAFTPLFSTTLGRSSQTTPPSSLLLGDEGVDVKDWFSSTGVRQRLPWGGGTWSASWEASRTRTTNPFTSFDPSLQSGLLLAFSQPLLRDRKIDAARQQFIVAERDRRNSELRYRESVVQTVAAVKQAYWTLKALRGNVTVQQRSLELAEELVRQNRVRVDIGQSPALDLVQAQAEAALRRENLIRATTAAGDAEDELRRLIMDPTDTAFWKARLDPVEDPEGREPLPDVDEVVTRALGGRYDIARAANDLEKARTNAEFFSDQKLPDVSLEASYRSSGLGGTELLRTGGFPGVVTGTASRGFGNVLNQVFSSDYSTWSFGVTVSYPLGSSYEEASLARARAEQRQAEQRIASLQLDAAESVRRAARQVRATAERVDAARASATLAEERLDTEQRRFEVGLGTSFLVTQAQRDLVQAQVNLLQATLDHQSARVSFEALQQAPPLGQDEVIGLSGSNVVRLPVSAPQGLFRQAGALQ